MHCIISEHSDPYFNLASEEYLLKGISEDIFLLYINDPSVVIGKHQNAMAEINHAYVLEKNIKVARRISGGGTVFHDPGNLNFTFITKGEEGKLVDYRRYTLPIIGALKAMGPDARLGERHELLLGDRKISGTASHVFKNRVLHHGTLLFSTVLEDLQNALKVKEESYEDRAVRSIKSEVTNIRDHLVEKMGMPDFQNRIYGHILNTMNGARTYRYNEKDLNEIHKLRDSKFSTWEWNFGYSPKYQFKKYIRFGTRKIVFCMNVEKGVIREIHIEGDLQGKRDIHQLEEALEGIIHDPETIRQKLSPICIGDYIEGLENEDLLAGMF